MASPTTQTGTVLPGTAVSNNGFSTNAVSPVPNATIQPASPITMPQTSVVTPADVNAYNQLLATQQQTTQANADQAQLNADTQAKTGQSLADLLTGKEAYSQQIAQEQKLPELQKQESDLRSTSLLQTANYIQGIRNLDAKNISQGERNTAQVEAQRQNAIDALLTNAQLSFTQGQVQAAQAQVKAAVDLKYNAIEQKIANSDKVLARLDTLAGQADTKAIQAAKDRNDQLKADIAEKKAQDLKTQQAITDATPFAPASIISQAQQAFKDGKSSMEIASILGQYNKDFLSNQLLSEQIKTQKSTQAKMDADTAKTKQETSDLRNAGQGGIPSKPLTEGQAKDFTYAQRADQASPKIENIGSKVTKMNPVSFKSQMALASSPLTSGNVSPEIRQYNQAVKNFITANLRRESGAQIAPSEFDDAYQVYIPFPGDGPTELAAKKQARETAIASFKGNVPGYDARISAQTSTEDKYLDNVVIPSVGTVEQQTTPVSLYTSRLLGLPGVKQ